jgi:epoxide hydrolase-like predicted phosphatase
VIRAVIFDYFGVISSDDYWRYVREDKNMTGIFHDLSDDVNKGRIHWQDFLKAVAEKIGTDPKEVARLYHTQQIHPDIVNLIVSLRKSYKTALLTNAHHEFLGPVLRETHLQDLFDAIVMSSEIGVTKPDPRIFEAILEKLQVCANEAIFIDDQTRHVEAAKALGIQSIYHHSYQETQKELDKLLANSKD